MRGLSFNQEIQYDFLVFLFVMTPAGCANGHQYLGQMRQRYDSE